MIATLNLVRAAVAKTSPIPALTHVALYNGFIQGGNGHISINAPWDDAFVRDVCVPADRFFSALSACEGLPKMTLHNDRMLSISRGTFRALLPTISLDVYPLAEHGDLTVAAGEGAWLPALRLLAPFMGDKTSDAWTQGIWLSSVDGCAYATNRVALARHPVPWSSADASLILPDFLVNLLLRIGKEPTQISYDDTSIVVDLPDGIWIRSQLVTGTFPNNVRNLITTVDKATNAQDVLAAVRKVRPFCPQPNRPGILLRYDSIQTDDGDMSAQVSGLALQLPSMRWNPDVLELMLRHAEVVDFSKVPSPFTGPCGFAGAGAPMRDE